jgi:hypothetical protein
LLEKCKLADRSHDGPLEGTCCTEGNKSSLTDKVDLEAPLKKVEMVRDEVIEAFTMPKFKAGAVGRRDVKSIELKPEVVSQLADYVAAIADRYQDNHFHNFEHASHVTMSAIKFLNRSVVPEKVNYNADSSDTDLHEYTFGITWDALSQFTVVFSALIHDVDHPGVPNRGLVQGRNLVLRQLHHPSCQETGRV